MGRVYKRVLTALPRPLRSRVDETVRSVLRPRVGVRPTVKEFGGVRVEPWPNGARAAVCISADLELAWASQYVSLTRALDEAQRTRRYLPALLREFDKAQIPVTWATVGHLLLESCRREDSGGRAHADLPTPEPYQNRYWAFPGGDWYQHDPCTSVREDPEWYAPDLLNAISASGIAHEIACHSFSHTDFSDAHCPSKLALADIRKCQALASGRGLRLRSFIFPGNFEGNFAVLRDSGFLAFRGSQGPELSFPTRENGMWNVRASLQIFDPDVDYSARLARYLSVAVRTQTCCHLSFHPSEPDPVQVDNVLVPMLTRLRELEVRGDVWIGTIGEVASQCEARSRATLHEAGPHNWRIDWRQPHGIIPGTSVTVSLPWNGSIPTLEIDGSEVERASGACSVREGRIYVTVGHPHKVLRLLRR